MLLLEKLVPAEELRRDSAFSRWFYSQWGKVNCLLHASATEAEYQPWEHRLSIRTVWRGEARCFIDNRTVLVDEDNYLIFNDRRKYASLIRSARPVHAFSIFFRPGLAEEVLGAMLTPQDLLLDRGTELQNKPVEFAEHLRPHDRCVTPILRYIARHVELGIKDEAWYEEQLSFLLERMLDNHRLTVQATRSLPVGRCAKRKELYRRLGWARDFIQANYRNRITIDDMARAACLSKFHFIRLFNALEGMTPCRYLQLKRVAAARRLLSSTDLSVAEIAQQVGFDNRSNMSRHMRRETGFSGRQLRLSDNETRSRASRQHQQ